MLREALARSPERRSCAEGDAPSVIDGQHVPVVATHRQQVVLWIPSSRSTLLDIVVEGATIMVRTAGGVGRGLGAVARPLAAVVLRPPLVGPQLQPATWLEAMMRNGRLHRGDAERELVRLLDRL